MVTKSWRDMGRGQAASLGLCDFNCRCHPLPARPRTALRPGGTRIASEGITVAGEVASWTAAATEQNQQTEQAERTSTS